MCLSGEHNTITLFSRSPVWYKRQMALGPKAGLCGRRAVSLLLAVGGLALFGASGASAATINVGLTAHNSAEASKELEAAVKQANADNEANTIVVAASEYAPGKTLTFTDTAGPQKVEGPSGLPSVDVPSATLNGSSVTEPHFPGELFVVDKGVSVTFKYVQISHAGGGVVSAIEDLGTLIVEDSTIAGNSGIGVSVATKANATITNSTLSDGLSFALVNAGTTEIVDSTIAFNQGGGLENISTLDLTNTIVADNQGSGNCVGTATKSVNSLDSENSCGVGTHANTDPELQESLANDGGSTAVHSLKPGSPAIGAGVSDCPATDQRGAPRATPCSIGADEYSNVKPTITVPKDITVEATETNEEGEEGAAVAFVVEGQGSNALAQVTCSTEPGSFFVVSPTPTTVSCTAEDGHENQVSGSFTVTVTKKVTVVPGPPTFSGVPGNISKEATSGSGAVVAYASPTATDPAGGTDTVTCVPASGSTFAIATTTVTCSATSKAGETGTATFKVTITEAKAKEVKGTPTAALLALLQEVDSARIPRGIRTELSVLLEQALRSLTPPPRIHFPIGFRGNLVAAVPFGQPLVQAFAVPARAPQHQCTTLQAYDDLGQFIAVIDRDQQRRRRAQIPAGLAIAWVKTAQSIQASLSCGSGGKSGNSGR